MLSRPQRQVLLEILEHESENNCIVIQMSPFNELHLQPCYFRILMMEQKLLGDYDQQEDKEEACKVVLWFEH